MAYQKQGLKNGDVVYAENVDIIEDGIIENEQNTATNEKNIEDNEKAIGDLQETKADKSEIPDLSELTEQVEKNTNDISTIKKTINTLHPSSAVAIYTADGTLTFDITYDATTIPEIGDTYNGSEIVNVYTGFEDKVYTSDISIPWFNNRTNFTTVIFTDSFENIKPIGTACWFCSMTNLTEIKGLEYLDTSAVTDMQYMFSECSGLTSLDVSKFNTSAVTNMAAMFQYCSGLTSLDVSNFNTSTVTDMQYMFHNCSGLTSLDVSNFDTSAVTTMAYMFNYCSGLTSLDVSNFDTSAVTTMAYMFRGCSGLTSLDVSNFDTSDVTNMNSMFNDCSSLTTIYSDDGNFVTTKVTASTNMFNSCSKLVGGNGTVYDSSKKDSSMAHVDTENNPGYFTQSPNVSPTTIFNEMHELVLELAEIAVNNGDLELLDIPANMQNELRVKLDDSKWKDR